MKVTAEELEKMRQVDIATVDKETLADVSGFVFDNTLSKEERMERVLEQFGNPYCFRYGDMAVKLEFEEDGPSLQDVLGDYLVRQKSGL